MGRAYQVQSRQEEVRSCCIPVISAGLGFHERHGHEPFVVGNELLSRYLQFNRNPGRTALEGTGPKASEPCESEDTIHA